jgi:hypothetical protein
MLKCRKNSVRLVKLAQLAQCAKYQSLYTTGIGGNVTDAVNSFVRNAAIGKLS